MNHAEYDIAIVGAGPAGATFARLIAEKRPDLKTVLIDDHQVEKQKPCGGLLAPAAQKKLAEQKLTLPKKVLADPQIFAVRTIDLQQNLDCSYQKKYFNMNRYAFDEWLISLIPNQVDILRQRCKEVKRGQSGFVLQLNSGAVIKSHYLIGADGASSLIRRSFFAAKKSNRYMAIQQWFKRQDFDRAEYYCVFDKQTGDAYSWFFNKDTYVVYGGAFQNKDSRFRFEEQKKKFAKKMQYDLTKPLKTEACQVVFPRSRKDIFLGANCAFLIGEAAGLISASSFEGISYALESGEKLALAFQKTKLKSHAATKTDKSDTARRLKRHYYQLMRKTKYRLWLKMLKRNILCQPFFRKIIMQSKVKALK